MSLISYAQNLEDVILFRSLKNVKNGFYIDVGAHDPVVGSVTKAFYEQGWLGINIEPVQQWFKKIETNRPRDINLHVAISAQPGELPFYEIVGTGLSTTNILYARRHEQKGFQLKTYKVPTITLDEIISKYLVETIHFLKIDVEGSEKTVLESISLKTVRPWIVVLEATEPNSQTQTYMDWEYLLLNREYVFSYFDGLNRFYIAKEHIDLKVAFAVPPNFFDDYILFKHLEEIANLKLHLEQLNDELQLVYRSKSWRITRPLRKLINLLKK